DHGGRRVAVEDPLSGALSYKRLLVGASVLGRKILALGEVGDAIGIMLPNANAAAATVLAAMSAGRVPAMINFSSGPMNVSGAVRAAKIRHVITPRAFV